MWRLLQNIAKDDEHGLYLGTNDFFRPGLKQIGNSLYEIRSYFIQKDGQGIAPTKLTTSLEQVKKRLIEHVENHAFDFVFDPLTSEVVDYPNPKAGPCFMFLAHSLSVVLDFPTSPRPSHTVCDVFLALPTQPVIVLSLVDGDAESPEAVMYNTSVARGVIETLSRFTDEDVNSIHGVIHTSILEDAASFETQLKRLANDSSHFVTRDSLVMTPGRYEKVLTAFWAGVAETKSVLKDTGDTDGDCLRFLTKEQCIILVENINDKDVQVKCLPGSGATTLMLEVARRLNRQGDTLLVCRSREERDRLRSVYPSAVAAEDLSTVDLSSCVNIVDETNTVMTHASSRNWRFAQICEAEREKEGMKKQIDVLSDGSMWKLLQNIAKEDEHGLYLGTNDLFRPDLKQIGDSLYEIRSYFIQKDGQNIVPKDLRTPLAQVKERLIEHIENHAFDFVFDPLTSEVVDFPNPRAGPCFMFLAHSLSEVLDFPTSPRPSHTVCDVFLALPRQPVIVLSLVDGDAESPETVMYNTSVARGVVETLSRFTDEDVNSIHGVIHTSILEDAASFETRLKRLANDSSHFVTRDSLVMTPSRYKQVLTAFWAGVAETKSVLKETGETDGDCLRFLTKEQCIILVENINDKDVQVKCVPGSGATTLMLEVARRLNRQGDTLLVCRSREERDRLRSVYPSAVAAEDLSTVDLSSCVNIVDETNTVMTHASSRKWRFGTYVTDIKELKSKICEAEREKEGMEKQIDVLSDGSMWKLLQNIAKEDEHGLYLGTNDLFRPDLKQIGDSLYEIRSYFIQKDGQNIAPTDLRTPLAQVKERLIEHIENHAFDFVFDPLTNEVVDVPNPKAGPCFMFLAHSLSVVLDFPTSPRPSHTVCDVFLALPRQPVIVLSLVDGDAESPETVMYNTSVARGVIETLSRFTDDDVNSIHGVIHTSILEDAASFETRLKKLANDSSHFVTRDSLVMTPSRYEKVLTAFWAGVAETKSVLKETGETDGDCLRFLTKEQCIILVENINDKDVQVKCVPGSGATTLMLEVARRLNRLGDTLLVCRSREERDRLRSVYPSAVAAEDLSTVDLSSCVNIVDETNTVMTHASSRKWRFGTNVTDIKELKSRICEAERETEGMEKQIDVLSDDAWKKQIEYLLRDFSVLKIFSYKLEQTWRISVRPLRHSLEVKPLWLTTSKALGGFRQLSAPHKAQLSDLHEGMRLRKNMFPLLRSVMIKDKTLQMYHELKMAHLRNALGKKEYTEWKHNFTMDGHVESPGIEQQMERLHFESGKEGKESDIQPVRKEGIQTTELEIEPQDTDGKDLESRWGEMDKLNHDLNNLLKDRDHRKEKLHKLYTVEWQATMEYLTRHTAVLSVLDIEVPGFDVLSGSITSQSDNTSDGRGHNKEQESKGYTRAPVLIHQLRQYQQGRLTENHLAAIAMEIIRENEQKLTELKAKNDSLEKDYGSAVHIVGLTCQPRLVSCPKRYLHAARANTDYCHVTTDGELVNSRPATRDEGRNRLQKYAGTCSTPTPLPPPPSTLTPHHTTPTYWETETRVRMARGVPWYVLEMGVVEAGQVDSRPWVSLQPRSWCVRVESCDSHGESICTRVWREEEQGECQQNAMSRTPGTQVTLHYGVVLDVGKGRVAFIDLDRGIVLVKYDVVFREPLVPMFGVGWQSSSYSVSMSLISGKDVDMTDTKRALVYQALR
ncbi:uncharacterized protein LOC125377395 isoform X2 [Haliotis rufescens]|uniref:uncharacterized protein LOC125377395 isoform X2 n=1 Tax=Haliotis rufescens TaxID=6454 RepID=UPI00201E78AE|nr:uncharacterized protein LOC125377395 isoform X2 [Haliotis rufescens]